MPEKPAAESIEEAELLEDLMLFGRLSLDEKLKLLDHSACLASEHEESPALPA